MVQLMQGWYAPRPKENAWQWGKQKIVLRSEESQDFAGPFDSEMTCYTRFLMEFPTGQFGENVEFLPGYEDREWDEFIQMKSSQSGFTLSVLVVGSEECAIS